MLGLLFFSTGPDTARMVNHENDYACRSVLGLLFFRTGPDMERMVNHENKCSLFPFFVFMIKMLFADLCPYSYL